jgi:hypothetical protein
VCRSSQREGALLERYLWHRVRRRVRCLRRALHRRYQRSQELRRLWHDLHGAGERQRQLRSGHLSGHL